MDNHQMNYDDGIENKTFDEILNNPSLKKNEYKVYKNR